MIASPDADGAARIADEPLIGLRTLPADRAKLLILTIVDVELISAGNDRCDFLIHGGLFCWGLGFVLCCVIGIELSS